MFGDVGVSASEAGADLRRSESSGSAIWFQVQVPFSYLQCAKHLEKRGGPNTGRWCPLISLHCDVQCLFGKGRVS